MENCIPLKHKVQTFVKVELLNFNKHSSPNVTGNPLPNHNGPKINFMEEDSTLRVKTKVDEEKTTMEEIHDVLIKIRAILKKESYVGKKKKGKL